MGDKFAPTYANIFVSLWEYCNNFEDIKSFRWLIWFYLSYIDDLILIIDRDLDLGQFINYLIGNKYSLQIINFEQPLEFNYLDISLMHSLTDNRVYVGAYRSKFTILRAESCHVTHVIRAIPKDQLIRLRQNCFTDEDFDKEAQELKSRLVCRGCKMDQIRGDTERLEQAPEDNTYKIPLEGWTGKLVPLYIITVTSDWIVIVKHLGKLKELSKDFCGSWLVISVERT